MIGADEDALFCDFAETYHIIDFYQLPVEIAARLATGLRDNSRIKSLLAGRIQPLDTYLLASAVDNLRYLVWAQTKDAEKGRNKPKPISTDFLIKKDKIKGYSSFEEFDRMREKILGVQHGN